MKTVYIPKGETVHYESLATEHLVVRGHLHVDYGIKAKTITGGGTINAGTVDADVIRVDDVESGSIVCKRLLAKRVQAPEVFASESAAVSSFLSAAYVETGRLTVALSEIDEVINPTPKKRTLLGTLLASLLRSFWTVLTVPGQKEPTVMTDACEEVPEDVTEPVPEETQEPETEQAAPCEEENAAEPEAVDEELSRIVGIFKLAREQGSTLKLMPGTPEENAPVFDFENERILRPAA